MPKEAIIIPGRKSGREVNLEPGKNLEAMVEAFEPCMDIFLWDRESNKLSPMKGRKSARDREFYVYLPGGTQRDYTDLTGFLGKRMSNTVQTMSTLEYDSAMLALDTRRFPSRAALRSWSYKYEDPHNRTWSVHDTPEMRARWQISMMQMPRFPLVVTPMSKPSGENGLDILDRDNGVLAETKQDLAQCFMQQMKEENLAGSSFTITEFPSLYMGQVRMWLDRGKVVGVEPHPLDPYEGSLEQLDDAVRQVELSFPRTYTPRAVDIARLTKKNEKAWGPVSDWILTGCISSCFATSSSFKHSYLGITVGDRD